MLKIPVMCWTSLVSRTLISPVKFNVFKLSYTSYFNVCSLHFATWYVAVTLLSALGCSIRVEGKKSILPLSASSLSLYSVHQHPPILLLPQRPLRLCWVWIHFKYNIEIYWSIIFHYFIHVLGDVDSGQGAEASFPTGAPSGFLSGNIEVDTGRPKFADILVAYATVEGMFVD